MATFCVVKNSGKGGVLLGMSAPPPPTPHAKNKGHQPLFTSKFMQLGSKDILLGGGLSQFPPPHPRFLGTPLAEKFPGSEEAEPYLEALDLVQTLLADLFVLVMELV